jgi:hypothetical protein
MDTNSAKTGKMLGPEMTGHGLMAKKPDAFGSAFHSCLFVFIRGLTE